MTTNSLTPEKRQRIRHSVRCFYDIQKLRIQAGNRSSGQAEESEIVLDEDDIAFFKLQSEGLELLEANALKEVKRLIRSVPIYKEFLEQQSGCGPTMSGVILSEVDIRRCETVSQLWSYCGLAVMDDGRTQRRVKGEKAGFNPWLKSKMVSVLAGCIIKAGGAQSRKLRIAAIEKHFGDGYLSSPDYLSFLEEKFPDLPPSKKSNKKGPVVTNEFLQAVMDEYELVIPSVGGWIGFYERYKHRKTSQLVDTCMNCKGTGKYKEKAKGVKGGSKKQPLIDHLGPPLTEDNKTHTCSNCKGTGGPAPWGMGAAHRDMAAKRFMIKQFLLEMWKKWRELEGLPVGKTYAEQYLHMQHGDHGPSDEVKAAFELRRAERLRSKKSAAPHHEQNGIG